MSNDVDQTKFPKMVFKVPGTTEFQNGLRGDTDIAYNEDGLKDLLADGWSETLEEAAEAHEKASAPPAKKEVAKKEEHAETAKQKAARLKAEEEASALRLKLVDEALALDIQVEEEWDNETIEAKIAAAKIEKEEKKD